MIEDFYHLGNKLIRIENGKLLVNNSNININFFTKEENNLGINLIECDVSSEIKIFKF